jgi:hypothetical protein
MSLSQEWWSRIADFSIKSSLRKSLARSKSNRFCFDKSRSRCCSWSTPCFALARHFPAARRFFSRAVFPLEVGFDGRASAGTGAKSFCCPSESAGDEDITSASRAASKLFVVSVNVGSREGSIMELIACAGCNGEFWSKIS